MRLDNYINESLIKKLENILIDCKPFFDEIKGSNRFLYRSTRKYIGKISILDRRKDRRPKDTNPKIHAEFDYLFYKKFGWRCRSEGVFAFGDSRSVTVYGTNHLFFPIGEFKFVWSNKIDDLYNHTPQNVIDINDIKNDLKNMVDSYQTTDLKEAIKSFNEVMFDCDRYYMVDISYEWQLLDMIGEKI